MLINAANLKDLFSGFKTTFNKSLEAAEIQYRDLAMVVPSSARDNTYGWLGQFPNLRKWIGDRVVLNLAAHKYTIVNETFEVTIALKRTEIEDDQYGLFAPMLENMGRTTAEHPDSLIFALLNAGFATLAYDGQNFFDTDHPVKAPDGSVTSASNTQAGDGPAWFLLDCSRPIRPLLFQERIPYEFTALDQPSDENVFWKDEFIYGVRARANAGFGLWQLAYASKAELNHENYELARAAMRELRGDEGRPLGVRPTHLVVRPSQEGAARRVVETDTRPITVGEETVSVGNEWRGTAKVVVSEFLAD